MDPTTHMDVTSAAAATSRPSPPAPLARTVKADLAAARAMTDRKEAELHASTLTLLQREVYVEERKVVHREKESVAQHTGSGWPNWLPFGPGKKQAAARAEADTAYDQISAATQKEKQATAAQTIAKLELNKARKIEHTLELFTSLLATSREPDGVANYDGLLAVSEEDACELIALHESGPIRGVPSNEFQEMFRKSDCSSYMVRGVLTPTQEGVPSSLFLLVLYFNSDGDPNNIFMTCAGDSISQVHSITTKDAKGQLIRYQCNQALLGLRRNIVEDGEPVQPSFNKIKQIMMRLDVVDSISQRGLRPFSERKHAASAPRAAE